MDAVVVAGVAVAVIGISAIVAAGNYIVSLLLPSRENDTIVQLEARYRQRRERAEKLARDAEDSRELARLTSAFEAITVEQNRLNTVEMRDAEAAVARKKKQDAAARTAMLLAARTRQLERTEAESASRRTDERRMAEQQTRLDAEMRRRLEEAAPVAAEVSGPSVARLRAIEAENRHRLREQKERIGRERETLERRAAEAREQEARESQQQTTDLASRIQPIVWPSEQEYRNARAKIQYSPTHFSFAVAGIAGSGKSSLINIFLDLPDTDPHAAPTGVVETTAEIRRYPDPGHEPPRKWTVWYDIPGAGTLNIPGWQYFNQQCLYVFDLIIVLVGDRMTQVDLEIIKNCQLFQIPTFIVRSKADQYIRNTLRSNGFESEYNIPADRRAHFRNDYIIKTRASIASQLVQAGLPQQRVYIVSCSRAFRAEYAAFTDGSRQPRWSNDGERDFVDEKALINDLMQAASERRCTVNPPPREEPANREQTTEPTTRGPANRGQGGTTRILCQYCPPHLARFSSQDSLRTHLASGAHPVNVRSAGTPGASRSASTSNQQSTAADVGCVPVVPAPRAANNTNRRRAPRPPLPPVDIVQWAQTMTETLATISPVTFSIDILQDIDALRMQTQLLILSPTRVLAAEISAHLTALGEPAGVRCYACVGGAELEDNQRALAERPAIVCGTPGRIADVIRRRYLLTRHIKVLALDVGGKLLTPDFRAEVQKVHAAMPGGVKVIRASMAPTARGRRRR